MKSLWKWILFSLLIIPALLSAQSYTFSGRVYSGSVGDQSSPLSGITVKLYGSNTDSEQGSTVLATTTTNATGWYGLTVSGDDLAWDYFNIVESNPSGYSSEGATTVSGTKKSHDWIQYSYPLDNKTFTGNKFWDKPNSVSYTFTGKVFEGDSGDESTPKSGVLMELYKSKNAYPATGTKIASATTDGNGWYSLATSQSEDYFYIIQGIPAGYEGVDATSVGGAKKENYWIQYEWPLAGKTMSGNKFWIRMEGQTPDNNPPRARAKLSSMTSYTGKVGELITLDASESYDPDAGDYISKYEWDLDYWSDGALQYDDATGVKVQKSWSLAGTYYVGVQVTDSHGATGWDSCLVHISEGGYDLRVLKSADIDGNLWTTTGDTFVSNWQFYIDANKNGQYDAGETEQRTDKNGAAFFRNLNYNETYIIREEMRDGWTQLQPGASDNYELTINPPPNSGSLWYTGFINQPPGTETTDKDYGDAPESGSYGYKTTQANGGASHVAAGPYLGYRRDTESDGNPTVQADGDDLLGSRDEDGLLSWAILLNGGTSTIYYTVNGGGGYVQMWIDFNRNGSWEHPGELVDCGYTAYTSNQVNFQVPQGSQVGSTYLRMRISSQGGLTPDGAAADGEVEDYLVGIIDNSSSENRDYGDAPSPYPSASNTLGSLWLGQVPPDAETNMQRNGNATGDDVTGVDDEDGLFKAVIVRGKPIQFIVYGTYPQPNPGLTVAAWIDYNHDGDWDDPLEALAPFIAAPGGTYSRYTIYWYTPVPASATLGRTFARIRTCANGGQATLSPIGDLGDGEVCDFEVEITEHGDTFPDGGIIFGYKWNDQDGDGSVGTFEPAMAGWTIWLDLNQNGVDDPAPIDRYAMTDATGEFIFTGLPDGTYKVGEVYQPGWTQTYPANTGWTTLSGPQMLGSGMHDVIVNSSLPATAVWFGNIRSGSDSEFDYGDAPDPGYPTLNASNGARHRADNGIIYFGSSVDVDPDGQPDSMAKGDDNDGNDDEDGISLGSPPIIGQSFTIDIVASGQGIVSAFIDWNQNQDWSDAGETILANYHVVAGLNTITVNVPAAAVPGFTYARFRISTLPNLTYEGPAENGEVEDLRFQVFEDTPDDPGDLEGPGWLKWSQPPTYFPMFPDTNQYHGWNETSVAPATMLADDWLCRDSNPVISITWWGAYTGWEEPDPPPNAPTAFHLGIWTDTPRGVDRDFSHPDSLVWNYFIGRNELGEEPGKHVFHPDRMMHPECTYRYTLNLPQPDWFHQRGDSTVYWLSVTALYEHHPQDTLWGWITRYHYYNDDAVRMLDPLVMEPGEVFVKGEPTATHWDQAFELHTTQLEYNYDYGDAPQPLYPTARAFGGAVHVIDPAIYMGSGVDADFDGDPQPNAVGDDFDGYDDEDGVFLLTPLVPMQTARLQVTVSETGFFNGWIDFNGNGNWDEFGDWILSDVILPPGNHILDFQVPEDVFFGDTYARYRFSTEPDAWFTGYMPNGEVEDHLVTIQEVTTAVPVTESQPRSLQLFQNYPNPFNPVTHIQYEVPQTTDVFLAIYNLRGQEVAVLVDGRQQTGMYHLEWWGEDITGRQLPSGIYFSVLRAAGQHVVKKMILIK